MKDCPSPFAELFLGSGRYEENKKTKLISAVTEALASFCRLTRVWGYCKQGISDADIRP